VLTGVGRGPSLRGRQRGAASAKGSLVRRLLLRCALAATTWELAMATPYSRFEVPGMFLAGASGLGDGPLALARQAGA
jgi:hypothetical protein